MFYKNIATFSYSCKIYLVRQMHMQHLEATDIKIQSPKLSLKGLKET